MDAIYDKRYTDLQHNTISTKFPIILFSGIKPTHFGFMSSLMGLHSVFFFLDICWEVTPYFRVHSLVYSRIASSRSQSFCMTTFSDSLTTLNGPPKSHDCTCHVGTTTPTLIYAHTTSRTVGAGNISPGWPENFSSGRQDGINLLKASGNFTYHQV
jgi:hypothetical protein